jgi:hypothetical protein
MIGSAHPSNVISSIPIRDGNRIPLCGYALGARLAVKSNGIGVARFTVLPETPAILDRNLKTLVADREGTDELRPSLA